MKLMQLMNDFYFRWVELPRILRAMKRPRKVCDTSEYKGLKIDRIFHDLKNPEYEIRRKADDALWTRELTVDEASKMIAAAAEEYPDYDMSEKLLKRLWQEPRPEYISLVEEGFDRLAGVFGQWATLRILTELGTRESLLLTAQLVRRPSSAGVAVYSALVPLTGGMSGEPSPTGKALFYDRSTKLRGFTHFVRSNAGHPRKATPLRISKRPKQRITPSSGL